MLREDDADRVSWAVSVHRAAALMVLTDDTGWVVRLVSAVRAMTGTPVVVVGDLGTGGVLTALAAGADTVLSSSTTDEEILARTYAVVRRTDERLAPTTRYLLAGRLAVDVWRRRARLDEQDLRLTPTEFDLLSYLMRHPERLLAPEAILAQVWGLGEPAGLNTLRIYVTRLRGKLGDDARRPRFVQSVRGHGYRFAVPVVEVPDEDRAGVTDEPGRGWLDALAKAATDLARAENDAERTTRLVEGVIGAGVADGAALHQVLDGRLVVRAHQGMSGDWVRACGEVGLSDAGLASSRAVATGRPVQFPSAGGYRRTSTVLREENFRSGLFLPVQVGPEGEVQACLGLVHRDRGAHRPTTLSYALALCAVYGAQLAPSAAGPVDALIGDRHGQHFSRLSQCGSGPR
ncbi:response regulator transcription factor [Amycolatopsis jiangsuensis]|uniref:DNA-binding response OmpR family regulator n=1 Tax=Amycolatopsis jiangsuensis TaxID=1181879 RepID=A0A840J882_9PSEU|nr:response regulator transcription factor [Amycolatopsis jiangsuensis]MBB4689632.1 DNA-binding response OmpR family regulator [Amycolatopsis jiangsuensis]